MKSIYPILLCAALSFSSSTLIAKEDQKERGHKPPPEAFTACEGKAEGDSVSIETPRGETLEATCKMMEEQLAAVPTKGERPKRKKD